MNLINVTCLNINTYMINNFSNPYILITLYPINFNPDK